MRRLSKSGCKKSMFFTFAEFRQLRQSNISCFSYTDPEMKARCIASLWTEIQYRSQSHCLHDRTNAGTNTIQDRWHQTIKQRSTTPTVKFWTSLLPDQHGQFARQFTINKRQAIIRIRLFDLRRIKYTYRNANTKLLPGGGAHKSQQSARILLAEVRSK